MWSVTQGKACKHYPRKLVIRSHIAKSLRKTAHAQRWGKHGAGPRDDKSNFFFFPALQHRTKTSTVIWIDIQWLKDPLLFSLLSSKSNTLWACKVVQLSWTAESMLFIKSHLQLKSRESISWAILATQLRTLRLISIRLGTNVQCLTWWAWGWANDIYLGHEINIICDPHTEETWVVKCPKLKSGLT